MYNQLAIKIMKKNFRSVFYRRFELQSLPGDQLVYKYFLRRENNEKEWETLPTIKNVDGAVNRKYHMRIQGDMCEENLGNMEPQKIFLFFCF